VLGTPAKNVMAELFGRTTGTSKGKGGSMHFFDKERNLFGGHGIVGGQIGLGAGIAFADKYKGNDSVTLCSMGDGAVRQGILHETFNMAMTWKLPVIFIIENNEYAMGTSVERTSNVHDLYTLGESYDMPGEAVNGMRCEDVHNAIAKACTYCRGGNGPYLLEIKTYRYRGHSMSDPQKYRSKEEVEEYKQQDPIEDVRRKTIVQQVGIEAELEKMDEAVKKEVEEAVKFAEDSPLSAAEEYGTTCTRHRTIRSSRTDDGHFAPTFCPAVLLGLLAACEKDTTPPDVTPGPAAPPPAYEGVYAGDSHYFYRTFNTMTGQYDTLEWWVSDTLVVTELASDTVQAELLSIATEASGDFILASNIGIGSDHAGQVGQYFPAFTWWNMIEFSPDSLPAQVEWTVAREESFGSPPWFRIVWFTGERL
jgi:pyruvate dehydrogenase E1 component alpha subunit